VSSFVDECGLNVRGGDGGAGAVAVRREAHVPMGGPDGGDGGKGGDVWLAADHNVASLLAFRDHPHRRAESGMHGSGKKKHGKAGADIDVAVPVGTVVLDRDGEVLADLTRHGERWLAAEGGRGGRGNAKFLSNKQRAPSFAEQGEPGDEHWLRLELKLMADVALVGIPNVGKSTLISRVSAAKPKIADYPFTTLEPNLGVVRQNDGSELVMADIPGLIEGASEGRGLGHQFLRHIERARVLLVLVDLGPDAMMPPAEQAEVLLHELGRYRPELLERPRVVAGSRSDLVPEDERPPLSEGGRNLDVSAMTGENLDRLLGLLFTEVRAVRQEDEESTEIVIHRPLPEGVQIARADDGSYVVLGKEARRAVALSDLTDPGAVLHAQNRLKKLGVDKALTRAGARPGDPVVIGELSFSFEEEGADLGARRRTSQERLDRRDQKRGLPAGRKRNPGSGGHGGGSS
jgi:GTP-binding protein